MIYLSHSCDGDGHSLAGVHPGRVDDEGEGGERYPLHPLHARAHHGAAAHDDAGAGAVEDAGDDQRLVGATGHHADIKAHLAVCTVN